MGSLFQTFYQFLQLPNTAYIFPNTASRTIMTLKYQHRFRFLPIAAVLFVAICLFPIDESLPVDNNGQSCFFVDGVPLCGEEGEKAREEQRKFIERMISQQQDRHLRADPDELPQGDDPMFESRVAYTGQANTNDKGQSQPVKGEPRPMPPPVKGEPRPLPTTTTPPPCPLMTTTTTPAPCPLMTTTTTTTTPKPLSPCEKWKLEQEQMRNNPPTQLGIIRTRTYVDRSGIAPEPDMDSMMMSDQPVLQAVVQEPIQDPMMSDQPMAPQQQQPSYHQQSSNIAQLGQFRGDPGYVATPDPISEAEEASTLGNSFMESLLPEDVRGANRGRLSLYHTFMDPSRMYQNDDAQRSSQQQEDYQNDES